MKKNILTVMVLALCLANLAMMALLLLTVVPTTKKTDALISQVAAVIQLELVGYDENSTNVADTESFKIEEKLTKNLKLDELDGGGTSHMAQLDYVNLTINIKSEKYEELQPLLEGLKPNIMDIVGRIISSYTYNEAYDGDGQEQIKKDILSELRKLIGASDFIVDVQLGGLVFI